MAVSPLLTWQYILVSVLPPVVLLLALPALKAGLLLQALCDPLQFLGTQKMQHCKQINVMHKLCSTIWLETS